MAQARTQPKSLLDTKTCPDALDSLLVASTQITERMNRGALQEFELLHAICACSPEEKHQIEKFINDLIEKKTVKERDCYLNRWNQAELKPKIIQISDSGTYGLNFLDIYKAATYLEYVANKSTHVTFTSRYEDNDECTINRQPFMWSNIESIPPSKPTVSEYVDYINKVMTVDTCCLVKMYTKDFMSLSSVTFLPMT